nr:DsrE family protein [Bradyrhizobium guangdongense]
MLRVSLAALFGALAARETAAATEAPARQRVVYHLADAERVVFVLGNLQNHVDGGVGFDACANTMKAQGVKLDDLTPGFVVAERGGVVRLAELQQQGYAYLRP